MDILTSLHGDRIGLSANNDLVMAGKLVIPATRIINLTASTLTITQDSHDLRTITINRSAGSTITLPAASGSGAKFRFIVGTAVTSNAIAIKVANASDSFAGLALGADDDAEGATGYTWKTDSGDDTISLDGSATGGKIGDIIEIEDIATNLFSIKAFIKQSGGSEATPFSATVS